MTTMAWGEDIQIFMELGFPVNQFTLDDAVLGVLDEDYLDGTLIGDDVSAYAQEISISRGRSDQLQNFNAGTFSVRLLNRDRRFDPINESSPYWNSTLGVSGVAPRRKVSVFSDGVALFTGRITDIDVSYEPNNPNATTENSYVTITASDDFVLLANTYTSSAITPTEVLSGTRVTQILDLPEVNYPATRNIDAGSAALGGGATFDIPANTNVLTYLQEVGASEQGYFFVAANGDLTFTDRITSAFSSPVAYFSDAGTNIPYTSLSVLYGQEFLYNKVVCAVEGGTDQVANDVASQTEYGISTLNLSGLLLVDDVAALTLASELLDRYKLPEYRFDKLQTIYNRLGSVDQATLTAVDIGDVVSITRTYPTGTPATVTKQYSIENIRHVITPNSHTVEYGLAVADIVYPFILAGFPVATVTRTNLLVNPSFEVSTSEWATTGTVARTTAESYSGVASASMTYTGAGIVLIEQSTRPVVTAGLAYTASFYMKQSVNTGVVVCNFMWYNAAGSVILDDSHQSNDPTTGWQRFSYTRTAPANAVSCSFRVYQFNGEGGGAIATVNYVDAFLIEQASSALPYFDGTYVDAYTGYGLDSKGWNGTANASTSTASWFVGDSRTNLIPNPSFETNTTGWVANQITLAQSSTFAYTGTNSLRGTVASTGTDRYIDKSFVTVMGGTAYSYSCWVYLPATNTADTNWSLIAYEWNGVTYTVANTLETRTITRGAWTRFSGSFTTAAATISVQIRFVSTASIASGQVIYLDGALLETGSTVRPYFDGTYVNDYAGYGLYSKAWNGTANASTSTANWYVGNTRTNLCNNPSFESDPVGEWGGYQATISRVAGSFGTGSFVGQAVATVAGVGGFFNSFAATAGVTYTTSLTGFRASGSRTYKLQFEFYNGATYLGGASTMSESFATPTRVSWTFTAPAGTTQAYIVCYSVGTGSIGDTLQIDNVLIEASSSLLPYFDGTYADTYTGYTLESQAWNGTADASTSTAVWGLTSSYVGTPMDSDYALT